MIAIMDIFITDRVFSVQFYTDCAVIKNFVQM